MCGVAVVYYFIWPLWLAWWCPTQTLFNAGLGAPAAGSAVSRQASALRPLRDTAAAESGLIQAHTSAWQATSMTDRWGRIKAWPSQPCLGLLWRDLCLQSILRGQLRLSLVLHHSSPFPPPSLLPAPLFHGCWSQGCSSINMLHTQLSLFPREPKLKQSLKETRARLCCYI